MSVSTVLVVIDDLFFLSKVQTTAQHLGLNIQVCTDRAGLQAHLATTMPALVIVDLTLGSGDAVSLIHTIRATTHGQKAPLLAFGAHVDVATRERALQAGAHRVVAKSEFSRRLPDLIQEHIASD
jgi:DNA-binding response OmpR family regulator